MSRDDELFAALQSARFTEVVDDRELASRSRIVARRIRRQERRDRWQARRRWWWALIAGVIVVAAGAGAVGAGLLHRQPVQQDLVWCYRYVPTDLTDDAARFGVLLLDSDQTTAQRAVELCYGNDDGTMRAIPDPVSQCILPDGSLAVIPIARCSDIGLPESDLQSPM